MHPPISAAFDTVDHSILLSVLADRFSIDSTAFIWFNSYLTDRTQTFVYAGVQSSNFPVECSVLQGSVLGPRCFISYTEDVVYLLQYSRTFTLTTLSSSITTDLKTLTRCEIVCRIAHATSSHGARLVVSDQIGRRPRSWCTSRSRTVDETAHNQSRLVRSVVASVAKWRLVSFSI